MKLSLNWLKHHASWDWTVDELIAKLTMSGTEVENVRRTGLETDKIITAKVVSFVQHPNADRLSVCQVDDGQGKGLRQIVCGAKNFKAGDIVPLAIPGAEMPGGFKIKESKLRGELSQGMMCSASELGLAADSDGLLLLDPSTPLGKPFKEIVRGDTVLEIEVTPNRADLLSYRGVARELAALGATAIPVGVEDVAAQGAPAWSVASDDAALCPRYTLQVVEGVKVGPSPDWLRQKLEAIGLRPINNVVDITNYVLFETGQPLHAFDAAKLNGSTITARAAREGETFAALNGKTYPLAAGDLVIADAQGPVALAGVMGGEHSSVTEGTSTVVLESALFQPATVRRTSRRLGLISDSSYRFERGVDPAGIDLARRLAVQLLVEVAGGTKVSGVAETAPVSIPKVAVTLRSERVAKLLGTAVSDEEISRILSSLGLKSSAPGVWEIPSFRPDLTREVDLIEEVARVHGLERVPSRLPAGAAFTSGADRRRAWLASLKQALAGAGYQEWITGSLLPRKFQKDDSVVIRNPLNEDYAVMRGSLLDSMLPCLAHNIAHGTATVKAFEIGRVWKAAAGAEAESLHLTVLASGEERPAHWSEGAQPYGFFSLKGVVERLAGLGLDAPLEAASLPAAVLKEHGIKAPVYAATFVLPAEVKREPAKFKPVSSYPAVVRDLALIVDRATAQETVRKAILSAGIRELESVDFFDLFVDDSGRKLPAGKKSLAYSLTYRSAERTLEEKDVNQWQEKVLSRVREAAGAELRA
jgi:phenylalanyl-tRNA synthetase beta chain